MSSSAPGSSGAIVTSRRPSRSGLEVVARDVGRRAQVASGRGRRGAPRRGTGPSRLKPSGSRAVGWGVRQPVADASAKSARSASGAVTAVGRNDGHAVARAGGGPSRRGPPRSPIASWPPQPWTWTSTKPGARYGRALGARLATAAELDRRLIEPSSMSITAGLDAIVEDQRDRATVPALRHRSIGTPSPRRRGPPRPIAPAQVPSSAVTTSTASSEVVRTRRRISARIGLEQQVAGRRDPATDDDPVGRETVTMLRDPDAEVAADLGQARRAPARRRARAASTAASTVAVPHAAAIRSARANASRQPWLPQPHERPVRVDRLMADLAGRPVMAEMDPPVDRDDAADPGARASGRPSMPRRGRHRAAAPPARTPGRR